MASNFSLFPNSKELTNSVAIRLIERVSGKTLTGYMLNLGYAAGTGIIVGLFLSVMEVALHVLVFGPSSIGVVAVKAVFTFFIFSLLIFLVCLLVVMTDGWKASLLAENKQYEKFISFASQLTVAALICLIALFFFSLHPFPKYFEVSQSDGIKSTCDGCSQAALASENISNASSIFSASANENLKSEYLINELNLKVVESMTAQEFNELLERHQFRSFNTESKKNEVMSTLGNISLFPKDRNIDWERFLVELDNVASENTTYIASKINSALINGAPFNIVVDILNRGHQLNGTHLASLATNLSVDELKKLENYGVDWSLTSSAGSNALVRSILNKGGPDVFEYLLNKNSLVFSEDVDVVKEVLSLSSALNRPIQYTQKLIDRGALVTEKTKEWIEHDLRKNNPRYYSLVKSKLSYN
ncbi:hypothetical protein MN202_06800 [Rheinheimera muenzenbergensis]|uniref:Ankyrin repeat-containing protein n=1 Tax=Rheinheimera muenzenbergensis TaxID=1193628 RepID=A0ABU8C4T1_9GAMM